MRDSHSPAIVKKKKKQGDLFPLLLQRFPDILESGDEIIQNFRGNHDPVPVGTHLFRNTHHFARAFCLRSRKNVLRSAMIFSVQIISSSTAVIFLRLNEAFRIEFPSRRVNVLFARADTPKPTGGDGRNSTPSTVFLAATLK